MGRLIDADALINRIDSIIKVNRLDTQKVWFTPNGAKLLVEEQPTIEERKGKWLQDKHDIAGYGYFDCSECGADFYDTYDFCPNCGAKMKHNEADQNV